MKDQRRRLRVSQAQERRGAALHGGRVRPASGALPMAKGDVRTPSATIEYKSTGKLQITVRLRDLEKIRQEALLDGRRALFGFVLGGRDYVVLEAEEYAGLEERDPGG